MCRNRWTGDAAILLAKQETWNLSVRVLLSREFLCLYNIEFTGSMGDIMIFAMPGGIILLKLDPEFQRYILLL